MERTNILHEGVKYCLQPIISLLESNLLFNKILVVIYLRT